MPFSLQYINRPLLNIHVSKSSVNSLKSVSCKYYSVVILSQFYKEKKTAEHMPGKVQLSETIFFASEMQRSVKMVSRCCTVLVIL